MASTETSITLSNKPMQNATAAGSLETPTRDIGSASPITSGLVSSGTGLEELSIIPVTDCYPNRWMAPPSS